MNKDRPRVAILTCGLYPTLFLEEQALLPAFAQGGIDAQAVVWSEGVRALAGFDLVVFRSTWDYFERADEFAAWLAELADSGMPVINPLSLIRWNLDKAYLVELAERGVLTVPTRHFKGGAELRVLDVMEEMGWSRAVIKPAVSGGAYRTYLVDRESAASHDPEANALRAGSGLLMQPYLEEIERDGEWSFVFFEGVFSHAVIKRPVAREFRVQLQFGGSVTPVSPSAKLLASAEAVLAALPEKPLYARVDGVVHGGELHLMEVELVEPYLYLQYAAGAAERYVDVIVRAAQRVRSASSITPPSDPSDQVTKG